MSRGAEIVGLMKELAAMPEYEVYARLRRLHISIYIFEKNYQDLARLINFLANDARAEPLFWLRNRDQLNLAMDDVIRLLHNFVAAALSLIDHTRRLHEKLYTNGKKFPEYRERVNTEFTHDPLSQFVKCLRQYCQHYKAPDLKVTQSWKRGDKRITKTFSLLKSDLESFEGWSATARRYLKTITEKADILEIATEYRNKVISFYEWFQSRQNEIHADPLQRLKMKENRLLSLILEDNIDITFVESKEGTPHKKDDIFISLLDSHEFSELESIPRNSPNRALRAIEMLEKQIPISDETKRRIIRLYELPDILPERDNKRSA